MEESYRSFHHKEHICKGEKLIQINQKKRILAEDRFKLQQSPATNLQPQIRKRKPHKQNSKEKQLTPGGEKQTSKDQTIGALILAVCILIAIAFIGLLFLYDPYIANIINLGAAADVQYWLIATPVTIAFIAIMAIGAWIGYTMLTTPPPKPIEEITAETA